MSSGTTRADPNGVEILLFEVGGALYGADTSQVVRIAQPRGTATPPSTSRSKPDGRALVFQTPQGETGQLRIDAVRGLRTVPISALRRLPVGIGPECFAIGVWLDGEKPVLLIDLHRLSGSMEGSDGWL